MKTNLIRNLTFLAIPLVVLSIATCGKRTETEKTTVIEREVEVPVAGEPSDGHLQRAGEKIDAKVDREIDEAIESSFND